ncbi:hypothetical protein [Moritella viscosa]|uniref:Restriction endonuclease type IV Mrr domain-containing protein n=1 Tax=Moritella viscosa TaxID=80854 RepID=A0ABY1HIX2_9GAMM|nr:hypothetical protein [Moritella viscosa]SGZ01932.1 Putative uncharacterized protein [Moritella viscosa]SGZ15391.1 Putative uncharacterized protein [Moritella viscosa]SHO28648.1 Putative uncharacterized protein [Moritella viscosa]
MTDYYSHKIEDIQSIYEDVCTWFDSLGFSYVRTRYGTYKNVFSEFLRIVNERDIPDDLADFKLKFDNAYLEVHEAIRIYNGLKEHDAPQFLEQLKKVMSGQEFRAKKSDDQARDFLFELSVATRFINAGYKVDLKGVCDIVVDLNNYKTLFVECKRIKSSKKIGKNVKKANEQLKKRLKKTGQPNAVGLVAINITDLLPKKEQLPFNSNIAATQFHRVTTQEFVFGNVLDLMSNKFDGCLGVMCESSMMNYFFTQSELNGFQYSRHTGHIPYSDSSLYENLSKELSNQDIK